MSGQRWFCVLSPDGAARAAGSHIIQALAESPAVSSKSFDTLVYRRGYSELLKVERDDCLADLLNQSLIVSCLDYQATHLLVLALSPVTLFSLNLLRRYGVKTIHWFYEDFRRARYWSDVIAGYDHFCAFQRGPLPDACEAGGAKFHFLPVACSVPVTGDLDPKSRMYDVAFIGIPSVYRIAVLEKLARKGFSLAIAGGGWKKYSGILRNSILIDRWTSDEESTSILTQSKIGINLSIDEPGEREITHVSPRVYDTLASGCLLLSENVPLLFESLSGCTFYTFDSPDDAAGLAEDLLARYIELLAFNEHNRRVILDRHSYRTRIGELLGMLSG